MLNELIAHLLVEVSATITELRQELDGIHYQVETVDVVLYAYVERSRDGTFLLVAANVHQTVVVTTVGQLVDERSISVEVEEYRLILGEQDVVLGVGQTVRVLGVRLQFEQVDNVDEADLNFRQLLVED